MQSDLWIFFIRKIIEYYLCGHNPLPLDHQSTASAGAVPPSADPLVTLEAGDHPMVSAAGALWGPQKPPRTGLRRHFNSLVKQFLR